MGSDERGPQELSLQFRDLSLPLILSAHLRRPSLSVGCKNNLGSANRKVQPNPRPSGDYRTLRSGLSLAV